MKELILLALRSRTEPWKRFELLTFLRSKGQDITDREVRQAVVDLIEKDGHLIASSIDGYFLITEPKQIEEAVDYLKKKAKSIAVRGNYLIHNWRKKHPEHVLQLDLFPEI